MSDLWEASKMQTVVPSLASHDNRSTVKNGGLKPISIEDLLKWAYRVELVRRDEQPATASITSDALAMLRKYGTRVQTSGWLGSVGWLEERFPPDPDAVRVNAAVQRLDTMMIDREPVGLFDDPAFAELTDDEKAAAYAAARCRVIGRDGRFRSSLAAFVIASAVLERPRPVRIADPIKRIELTASNGARMWFRTVTQSAGDGRPDFAVEVSGYNHKRQRPFPDAYRKTRLDPDPAPIIAERLEYQAWRMALDVLVEDLDGQLERFAPIASDRTFWPWQAEYDHGSVDNLSCRAIGDPCRA